MENTKTLLYVECKKSQKETAYTCLTADLGYSTKIITFDRALISELTGISLKDLSLMPIGTKKPVGSLILN